MDGRSQLRNRMRRVMSLAQNGFSASSGEVSFHAPCLPSVETGCGGNAVTV
jgi:hypothetical protein